MLERARFECTLSIADVLHVGMTWGVHRSEETLEWNYPERSMPLLFGAEFERKSEGGFKRYVFSSSNVGAGQSRRGDRTVTAITLTKSLLTIMRFRSSTFVGPDTA
jgi:hypothetical protein